MIEHLQTLKALEKYKTMQKAATQLRVTQPTVSKRIAQLEIYLKKKLIQKEGRRVVLTAAAKRILEQAHPHLMALNAALHAQSQHSVEVYHAGFSESILSSWGADLLKKMLLKQDTLNIIPHAHRSPVVIDRVLSGEYAFGLCAGGANKAQDLEIVEVYREPMVLIEGGQFPGLMSIEAHSETMQAIERQMKKQKIEPTHYLESYTAIASLAQKKIINAMVPLGVCKALSIQMKRYKMLKITRPIVFMARKNVMQRKDIQKTLQGIFQFLKP